MAATSQIGDIIEELHRRHLIPDITRVKHQILFPRHQFASLELTDILKDVGICDLSILHLRTSILGGSPSKNVHRNQSETSSNSSSWLEQKVTNSPLVAILPFSVEGISDDSWRSWAEKMPADLDIPPNIRFHVRYDIFHNKNHLVNPWARISSLLSVR